RCRAAADRSRGEWRAAARAPSTGAAVSAGVRPLRCLIVSADPLTAALLDGALERGRGLVGAGRVDPVHALAGMRPACDVILIAEGSDERGLRLVGDLAIAAPGVPTLLVTSRPDMGILREAM